MSGRRKCIMRGRGSGTLPDVYRPVEPPRQLGGQHPGRLLRGDEYELDKENFTPVFKLPEVRQNRYVGTKNTFDENHGSLRKNVELFKKDIKVTSYGADVNLENLPLPLCELARGAPVNPGDGRLFQHIQKGYNDGGTRDFVPLLVAPREADGGFNAKIQRCILILRKLGITRVKVGERSGKVNGLNSLLDRMVAWSTKADPNHFKHSLEELTTVNANIALGVEMDVALGQRFDTEILTGPPSQPFIIGLVPIVQSGLEPLRCVIAERCGSSLIGLTPGDKWADLLRLVADEFQYQSLVVRVPDDEDPYADCEGDGLAARNLEAASAQAGLQITRRVAKNSRTGKYERVAPSATCPRGFKLLPTPIFVICNQLPDSVKRQLENFQTLNPEEYKQLRPADQLCVLWYRWVRLPEAQRLSGGRVELFLTQELEESFHRMMRNCLECADACHERRVCRSCSINYA